MNRDFFQSIIYINLRRTTKYKARNVPCVMIFLLKEQNEILRVMTVNRERD